MTTQQNAADDARAALAAAALVVAHRAAPGSPMFEREKHPTILFAPTVHSAGVITLAMADEFLRWLQRNRRGLTTVQPGDRNERDDRLTPGVDFRSPSQEPTQRLRTLREIPKPTHRVAQPSSISLKIVCVCGEKWPCRLQGDDLPHELSPALLTPSGRRACHCGQSWPCSLREMPERAEGMG